MVALKEKQAVVCGPLGEIQATLCAGGRDRRGEAAAGHLLPRALCWSLAVAVQLPVSIVTVLGCDVPPAVHI